MNEQERRAWLLDEVREHARVAKELAKQQQRADRLLALLQAELYPRFGRILTEAEIDAYVSESVL